MKRDRALLIGDACVFTAATFAIGMSLVLGLWALAGSPGPSVFWELVNTFSMFAGMAAGVVTAWLLHGRRIKVPAVVGAIVGTGATGAVIASLAGIAFVLSLPLSLFTTSEFAGPLALLAIVSAGFIALIVWLLVDAVRDLRRPSRAHARLDVTRIAAVVVLAVYFAGVAIVTMQSGGGGEEPEAAIFALAAGVSGALMVGGAELATVFAARQQHTKAPSIAA